MSNDAHDLAFARHVRQIGLITAEQVNSALQTQSKCLQDGKTITVAEAMVQLGLLTSAQRESLEKKVKEQQAGVQQLGPYKLMKKLGEGGMGAVYLALEPTSQRHVAVKVLPRAMGGNAEFVKRFRREAEAATRLKHPNIIGAFSAGEDLGYHYYVMEYCEGRALDAVLAVEKQLPVAQALDIVLQAATGLKYAHDQGIIHRDIKPSNIIVAKDGLVKILDLGLSKNLEESAVSFKTVTGAVLGTPHYISPEQAQGERTVDGRSDIYSLGATLYHLLTGQVPFDGGSALEILSKHVNTVLPNPQDLREDIPDAAVQVLLRMMAKDPADRYHDCGALIADLHEVNSGRVPKTHMISAALTTIAPAKRSLPKKRPATIRRAAAPRRNRSALIAGGAAAVAVAVILTIALSGNNPPAPAPTPITKAPPPSKGPETPKFDPATWEKSLAELQPDGKLKAVITRLKDLNPGYDGSERHETGHGRISRLELSHVALQDLSPLKVLSNLGQLDLFGTSVSDLSPLRDTKIVSLTCSGMKSLDLKSIRGMKELKLLSLKSTPVRDLSPLSGMELSQLNLRGTSVADLSPLRNVKLRELLCDFDAKRDTEVLKSMLDLDKINDLPVEEFWKKEKPAEAPVASGPEEQFRKVFARLRELNPSYEGRERHRIEGDAVTELYSYVIGVSDITPISELKSLRILWLNGRWDEAAGREIRSAMKDISPIRGLPLTQVRLDHTDVDDLSALQGMKLEDLDVAGSPVSSLAPLRDMPLKRLIIGWTRVRDLSPLKGAPLEEIDLRETRVEDFSLLRSFPLREIRGNFDPVRDGAWIQSLRTLRRINDQSVAEFLKPKTPPPPVLPPAPPADAAAWKNAIDLIQHIDVARDLVRGNWRKENGRIISEFGENGVLRLPYEPPPEYDFKIVFTRARGNCAVAQFLQRDGRGFFWEMAGHGNSNSGFANIGGKSSRENPTNYNFVPRDGVRYTCVIQVRRDRVTALLDDKKISEWVPAMGEITTEPNWCVDVPNHIGLGNCESLTTFDVVQLREVTGKGRLRTTLTTPPDAAFLQTVARLGAQDQAKRVIEKLKDLNPGFDPDQVRFRVENERVVEFGSSTRRLMDLWPVRAFASLRKLDLGDDKAAGVLSDLTCLKGMRLQELNLKGTRVSDLTPLAQMPLVLLDLEGTRVSNLAPLRSMKLTQLSVSGTPVADLVPIKDLPLQQFECEKILASDFSPLKSIRSLKTINDQPAAEFFKNTLPREAWTPVFDGRSLDCLRAPRGWKVDKGALVNDPEEMNSAQTKFEFENGELRIRFEVKGVDSCHFRVRQSEAGASGVFFDGIQSRALEGKSHELIFTCRGNQVAATLDGRAATVSENQGRNGCLQFNATKGTLRVTAIEFRSAP